MTEENTELQDSQTPDELDVDLDQNDANDITDVDELQAKNRQIFARAKRAEETAKALKEELESLKTPSDENLNKPNTNGLTEERLERLELKQDGLTDDQIDFLMELGGKKALDRPFVKKALQGVREEADAMQSVQMNESTKSGKGQKFISVDNTQHMSADEMRKAIQQGRIKE